MLERNYVSALDHLVRLNAVLLWSIRYLCGMLAMFSCHIYHYKADKCCKKSHANLLKNYVIQMWGRGVCQKMMLDGGGVVLHLKPRQQSVIRNNSAFIVSLWTIYCFSETETLQIILAFLWRRLCMVQVRSMKSKYSLNQFYGKWHSTGYIFW